MRPFKLKATGEQVFEVPSLREDAHEGDYRCILKPFHRITRRGHRGELMRVRRDRLVKEDQE